MDGDDYYDPLTHIVNCRQNPMTSIVQKNMKEFALTNFKAYNVC
jgi:hypothetical protein